MTYLPNCRTLVTGGAGSSQRYVVRALTARGIGEVLFPRRQEYDLTSEAAVARA